MVGGKLVEIIGIEPIRYALFPAAGCRFAPNRRPSRCESGRSPGWREVGGDNRDRTDDLCSAIAALSQLSYIPVNSRIPKGSSN